MTAQPLAIFDFDGTIADSASWFFGAVNEVARSHRLREISVEEREMLRGRSSREIIAHLGIPAWKLPVVAKELRGLATRDVAMIRLFPWVPDILAWLANAGVTIAVVSSNSEANIRRVLGAEASARLAYCAAGAALFGKAAKIGAVMRRVGASASATVAIGDEVRDIEAAHAAGVASLAVTWGYATPAALRAARPTGLVHQPAEILDWLTAPIGSEGNRPGSRYLT